MTGDLGGTAGFVGASAGKEAVTDRSSEGDGLGGTATGALGLIEAGGAGEVAEGDRHRPGSKSESSDVGPSGRSRMIGKVGVVVVTGVDIAVGSCVRCFFFGRASDSLFLGWPGSIALKDLRDSRSRSVAAVPTIDAAGKPAGLDDSTRAEAECGAVAGRVSSIGYGPLRIDKGRRFGSGLMTIWNSSV